MLLQILHKGTTVTMLCFVVSSMLVTGASLTLAQIVHPLRNVRLVAVTLLANFILMPLAALILARALWLDDAFGVGLLLLGCAAGAIGLARASRELAIGYANQREQFGQKIGQFQMNQDLIAQMVVQEEAARLLVYRAACLADRGQPYNLQASMAKYAAAEAAAFCADAALKILGAYGYSTEFPAERYYRDAKSYQIVEGSVNIQKLIIAQDALGYRKASR